MQHVLQSNHQHKTRTNSHSISGHKLDPAIQTYITSYSKSSLILVSDAAQEEISKKTCIKVYRKLFFQRNYSIMKKQSLQQALWPVMKNAPHKLSSSLWESSWTPILFFGCLIWVISVIMHHHQLFYFVMGNDWFLQLLYVTKRLSLYMYKIINLDWSSHSCPCSV